MAARHTEILARKPVTAGTGFDDFRSVEPKVAGHRLSGTSGVGLKGRHHRLVVIHFCLVTLTQLAVVLWDPISFPTTIRT